MHSTKKYQWKKCLKPLITIERYHSPLRSAISHYALLFVFLFYLSLTIASNLYSNAFSSELGAASDEPAHYLTVVMLVKYFLEIFPADPVSFFKDFYAHYPKIGLGNWPPFFYLFSSFFGIIFGKSIISMFFWQSLIGAITLTLTYQILINFIKSKVTIFIPCVLFLFFEWQKQLSIFMLDHFVELNILLSLILFKNFLRHKTILNSSLLSIALAIGCLSKGNYLFCYIWIVLAFFVFYRKQDFKNFRSFGFLIFPAILTFIWYYFNLKFTILASIKSESSIQYALKTLRIINTFLLNEIGLVLYSILLVALAHQLYTIFRDRLFRSNNEETTVVLSKLAFLAFCSYISLHLVFQSGQDGRHYISLLTLAIIIICYFLKILTRNLGRYQNVLIILFILLAPLCNSPKLYKKSLNGARQVAEYINKNVPVDQRIMLASNPFGQGALIVEIANLDRNYQRYLSRSEKLLALSNWSVTHYEKKYNTFEELEKILLSEEVDTIVIDLTVEKEFPEKHHFDLQLYLEQSSIYKLEKSFSYHNRYLYLEDGILLYQRIAS